MVRPLSTLTFWFVLEAFTSVLTSPSTFEYLSKSSEIVHQSVSLEEAQACQDLLSQARYHLDRAKAREEQERLFRQRQVCFHLEGLALKVRRFTFILKLQVEEREEQRRKQAELQAQEEAIRLERERQKEETRGKFIEKAKQISLESAAMVSSYFSISK